MPKPKVFISYAHRNEPETSGPGEIKWLSYVASHLKPLENAANIESYSDLETLGSQDWRTRIFKAIDECDIFILLVSPDSLGSRFITQEEIPRLIERQQVNGSTERPAFYPILIKPTAGLKEFNWLDTPNIRPKNRKALSEYPPTGTANIDWAMASIANEVLLLAKSVMNVASPPIPSPPGNVGIPPKSPDTGKAARTPTVVGADIPPVSGTYDLSPPQQSQGASGLDPVLREVLLCLAFTGLSRITTKHGTLVFSIRQALLHTTITGGRIASTKRAFPEGWQGPRAQVTRIGIGPIKEILRIHAEDGLDGEVLAGRGDSGHLRLFDVEPTDGTLAVSGEIQVTYEAVHVDLDRSETPRKRRNLKSDRRKQLEAELAKLILEESGLARLRLAGCVG